MTYRKFKRKCKLMIRDLFNPAKCQERCEFRKQMWRAHLANQRLKRDIARLKEAIEANQD